MKERILLATGLAFVLLLLVGLALTGQPALALAPTRPPICDRYVLGIDGSNSTDCSQEAHPCKTVQYAIDQALTGDRICVADHSTAPGPTVYAETILVNKTVTLDGSWQAACMGIHPMLCDFTYVACDPDMVVLDAQRKGRVIHIQGRISPQITCFTITGGDASGLGGHPGGSSGVDSDAGGGIYSNGAAPLIDQTVITGNYGCQGTGCSAYGRGGGVYLLNAPAEAEIQNSVIAYNQSDKDSTLGYGGGIMLYNSDALIEYNTIERNQAGTTAGNGGGIYAEGGSPRIVGNDILYNRAGVAVAGTGGGIYVWSSEPVTIEGNLIQSNRALSGTTMAGLTSIGGGIYFSGTLDSPAVIRNNDILYNLATIAGEGRGGGLYLNNCQATLEVDGNTIQGNVAAPNAQGAGGGLYLGNCNAAVTDNQILENYAAFGGTMGEGGGVYVSRGTVHIAGNDIVGNGGTTVTGIGYGGGLALSESDTLIEDNQITGNRSSYSTNLSVGGGIYVYSGTTRIVSNTISGNYVTWGSMGFGGGVYLGETEAWLERNTIIGNVAADNGANGRGGGVRAGLNVVLTMTNNVVAHNFAGGEGSGVAVRANCSGLLVHNTIAENVGSQVAPYASDGVGIYVVDDSQLALTNNIVVSQVYGIYVEDPPTSSVAADYTLFENNVTNYSAGVVSTNQVPGPALLTSEYRPALGSSAIDAGDSLTWVLVDRDGAHRPDCVFWDVGAFEVQGLPCYRLRLPLVARAGP